MDKHPLVIHKPAGRFGHVKTAELAAHLDVYLDVSQVPDSSVALNGLQVENGGEATRIAAAVDASQAVIEMAIAGGCDFLLVHHGLFWDGHVPVTGRRYRKLKLLMEAGVSVYSAHIPLDIHPDVGNNAVLGRELGVALKGTFSDYQGVDLGRWGELEITREALAARLDDLLGGRVRLLPGGKERIHTVGVITGGAGDRIGDALDAGLDAFVTGEGAHHTYFDAVEGGINVYYGGHYATETWGVRALAGQLSERFDLPWEFIDQPTGL